VETPESGKERTKNQAGYYLVPISYRLSHPVPHTSGSVHSARHLATAKLPEPGAPYHVFLPLL